MNTPTSLQSAPGELTRNQVKQWLPIRVRPSEHSHTHPGQIRSELIGLNTCGSDTLD
jgi:hypothetical protein